MARESEVVEPEEFGVESKKTAAEGFKFVASPLALVGGIIGLFVYLDRREQKRHGGTTRQKSSAANRDAERRIDAKYGRST